GDISRAGPQGRLNPQTGLPGKLVVRRGLPCLGQPAQAIGPAPPAGTALERSPPAGQCRRELARSPGRPRRGTESTAAAFPRPAAALLPAGQDARRGGPGTGLERDHPARATGARTGSAPLAPAPPRPDALGRAAEWPARRETCCRSPTPCPGD